MRQALGLRVRSSIQSNNATEPATSPSVFDRQIRAFGSAGQHLLAHLRVGVVGAGGTGSAVCEQLIRLGVGEITVIDDDVINDDGSNVTRVWGSTMADIGMPKVDIVARTAAHIGFSTRINPIKGTINDEANARELRHCDVIFGCTDDNRGRMTLSRIGTWYLIPVIDMGVEAELDCGRAHQHRRSGHDH
jgi:molybdopterin/thiamine biosynthesis adenylyltransferase